MEVERAAEGANEGDGPFRAACAWSVHGLRLQADRPLPGLVGAPAAPGVDVRVWCAAPPSWVRRMPEGDQRLWHASPSRDARGRPALTIWELGRGACLRLRYGDGAEFFVDRNGSRVWAKPSERATRQDTVSYLLGPVLSLVLSLRGITCLRASAIAVQDEAIAFVGPVGAGKSTTAAALGARGYPVLSDDLVALGERGETFVAHPGLPWLRLRPTAVDALALAAGVPPPLAPTPDGWYLDLDLTRPGYRFQPGPLPLAAIYLLDERGAHPGAPCVDAVPAADALISLIANTWTTRVLDGAMRAREFELLGRVASAVPVRRVRSHADPARLPELCDVLVEDLRAVV